MGGANWLTDIVRTFLSLFDRMVYWFIGLLISLFDQLATVQLFDDNIIGEFSKRIFFLVSVVMIFKVSFSIVKYIINPDTFSDKERDSKCYHRTCLSCRDWTGIYLGI